MGKIKEGNKSESKTKKKDVLKVNVKNNSALIEMQKKTHIMTKSRVKLTLKMLEPKNCLKVKPVKNCSQRIEKLNFPGCFYMWDSSAFLVNTIRSCILTNNWNGLTKLLLLMYRKNGKSTYFIKQLTKLNLMRNPDSNEELLKTFLGNIQLTLNRRKRC